MKTFEQQCAQGDIWFRRVDTIPADAVEQPRDKGPLVVSHSETGHHHQFAGVGTKIFTTADPLVCYLRMESPDVLSHMRDFNTHEEIQFGAGCVEMHRQRERAYVPAGWRVVAD